MKWNDNDLQNCINWNISASSSSSSSPQSSSSSSSSSHPLVFVVDPSLCSSFNWLSATNKLNMHERQKLHRRTINAWNSSRRNSLFRRERNFICHANFPFSRTQYRLQYYYSQPYKEQNYCARIITNYFESIWMTCVKDFGFRAWLSPYYFEIFPVAVTVTNHPFVWPRSTYEQDMNM